MLGGVENTVAPQFAVLFFPGCRHWLFAGSGRAQGWFASLPLHGALDQKTCSRLGRWVFPEDPVGRKGLGVMESRQQ